jgi:hypothetical protein
LGNNPYLASRCEVSTPYGPIKDKEDEEEALRREDWRKRKETRRACELLVWYFTVLSVFFHLPPFFPCLLCASLSPWTIPRHGQEEFHFHPTRQIIRLPSLSLPSTQRNERSSFPRLIHLFQHIDFCCHFRLVCVFAVRSCTILTHSSVVRVAASTSNRADQDRQRAKESAPLCFRRRESKPFCKHT